MLQAMVEVEVTRQAEKFQVALILQGSMIFSRWWKNKQGNLGHLRAEMQQTCSRFPAQGRTL